MQSCVTVGRVHAVSVWYFICGVFGGRLASYLGFSVYSSESCRLVLVSGGFGRKLAFLLALLKVSGRVLVQ